MATAAKSPKYITIRGRLSFPRFTVNEAIAQNSKSKFPKADLNDVKPEFNLLLEQDQLDKLTAHITGEFLPYTADQAAKGEKHDSLDARQIKKVETLIASGDWADQPPYIPIKVVNEKTLELAPESIVSVKVSGPKGRDIKLKAAVHSEDQLAVNDGSQTNFPALFDINATTLEVYPGAFVAVKIELYAYTSSGSNFGISASADTVVVLGNVEAPRIGGGGATGVDEDDIFLDD